MASREAVTVAARRFGVDTLKPEQEDAIKAFVGGRDVFVCLPTKYGKSLCFALLPYVYDHLRGLDTSQPAPSIANCVSPLQSLMMDQYRRLA